MIIDPHSVSLAGLKSSAYVRFSLLALSSIFFLVDPFAALPTFLAVTAGADKAKQRRMAGKASITALIFLSAFGTLAISFWPYMIPYVITVEEAAAPHSSLAFMFWGEGIFVYPLMLIYTVVSYRVFRGKISATPGH